MKPSDFVQNELGEYSSHPRFTSRRLRDWTMVGVIPLLLVGAYFCWQGAGITDFFAQLANWDFWAVLASAAIWFFLGMVLTVHISIYLSGFEGANGGARTLGFPAAMIFGIGLVLALVPVAVFVGFGRLMDSWEPSQKAQYLTYAASLSFLPLFIAFAALEILGERRNGKKRRGGRKVFSAFNGIIGLIGFALMFPSIAAWAMGKSPDWMKRLLPGGVEALVPGVAEVMPDLRRLAFQIVTIGSLVLLTFAVGLAFSLIRGWAKESAKEDEEDKIEDPVRAAFDQGPPSPLAIHAGSFHEQPRGLQVKTKAELRGEREVAEDSDKSSYESKGGTIESNDAPLDEKPAPPSALTAVAVALGLMEQSAPVRIPTPASSAPPVAEIKDPSGASASDIGAQPELGEREPSSATKDEQNPNPCELDSVPQGMQFSEIVQEYPGQEFGVLRPSLDQFIALQNFQQKWADVIDQHKVKTGSVQDTATLSAADMIIEGDPGCGRTTVLLAMAFHAVAVRGQSVLFIAPPGTAANAIAQRLAENFLRSSVGPFVSVRRLRPFDIEELARVGSAKAESEDDAQRASQVSKVGKTVAIPDVAVVTAEEYEQGFFGASGSPHGVRALLHRYQVVLVDDILELDIWSRIHLPFLLDKHRLILGVDGYRFQTVVAASRMTMAARKLIEKRLFAAVGSIERFHLRPWDDIVTWKLDVPADGGLEAGILKAVHTLLELGLDVAVRREGMAEVQIKSEATRLVVKGRGPRVVGSLASLASSASEAEVARRGIPGSTQTPIPDPTLWRLAQDCPAIIAAYDQSEQKRIVVRFTECATRAALPTRVPIMASARSRGISWSHVGSVCRLVRPYVPTHRNLWAKLGLGDSEDERPYGALALHEAYETIRKVEVDPPIGDHLTRSSQAVFPWVVLLPATAISAAGESEEIPPKPVDFNAARLHGYDLLRESGDTILKVVRRSVDEPFVSLWNTDQGLTAGRHDLSYLPSLRIGTVGETMQKGGAAFATRMFKAPPAPTVRRAGRTHASTEPPPPQGISVECRPFESAESDPYMPWWQLSARLSVRRRGAVDPHSITIDSIGVLWPSVAWVDYEHSRRILEGASDAELDWPLRSMASIRIERLFSRRGTLNPVSPNVAFDYECSTSFMLFSIPDQRDVINASAETLVPGIAEMLGGTWTTAPAIGDGSRRAVPPRALGRERLRQIISDPSSGEPDRFPGKSMVYNWSVPGIEGKKAIPLQVEWTLNLNLARARLNRFGVVPAMKQLAWVGETDRQLRLAELRALAAERGLSLHADEAGSEDSLVFKVDYARLTMDGAADLRGLAERIIEAAVKSGLRSDREIAAAIVSFVQHTVEYRVPARHGHDGPVDSEDVDRIGMKPAISTLADGHGDCDCSSILAAALLHVTGQFQTMGFRVTHEGAQHFLIGLQLLPERGDQSVEIDGVHYLPIETTDQGWRIGQSPTIGNGSSFTPEPLALDEDIARFELASDLERERDFIPSPDVDQFAAAGRQHSPFMSAVLMVAFRRHVPQFESVCRLAAFRFRDNDNWAFGVMFVEPAPTQRTVSETLREVLHDRPLLYEFFTTCARLCDRRIDELCADAEQRLGELDPTGAYVDPCLPADLKLLFEELALKADPDALQVE